LSVGLVALVACRNTETVAPQATVFFVLDAPFCSTKIPAEFLIDNVQVGTDTFRVRLPPDHITSRAFTTSPGQHVLRARHLNGYVWASRNVALVAGQAFPDSLPFYCS
jgi:hypothetical protein